MTSCVSSLYNGSYDWGSSLISVSLTSYTCVDALVCLSYSSLTLISIALFIISSSSSISSFLFYSLLSDNSIAFLIISSSYNLSCSDKTRAGYRFAVLGYSFVYIINKACSFSSWFLLIMSFLNAMKLSTAVIWSTIFLWRGFALAISHASINYSYVTPSSVIRSSNKSSTSFLNSY